MKTINIIFISITLAVLLYSVASAEISVIMKNGEIIDAQEAWQEGETVFIQVNPEVLLDFPRADVDLKKTKIRKIKLTKASLELLDQVLEISGTLKQIDGFGSHFSGGEGNGESDGAIEGMFRDSFDPADARKRFRQHLAQKLEAFQSQDAQSLPEERRKLIAKINKTIGLSEFELRVIKKMAKAMIDAIPADFPNRDKMRKQMTGSFKGLNNSQEKMRQVNIASTAYTYRDLSTAEIGEYLDFLQSASGGKYTKASLDGIEKVFDTFTEKFKKKFRTALVEMRKQNQ